jgi:hypothetical protein
MEDQRVGLGTGPVDELSAFELPDEELDDVRGGLCEYEMLCIP